MNSKTRLVLAIVYTVLAAPMALPAQAVATREALPTASATATGFAMASAAMEVAQQGGDSAYRAAQRVLQDGDYREAARQFQRYAERYPRSSNAPEALYWQAFALSRVGNSSSYSAALEALNELNRQYPSSNANQSDAGSLRVRICGELARRGDESCAREVVTTAESGSRSGQSPSSSSRPSQNSSGQQSGCPREDDENDERIMALNALLNMNSESAVPILEKVLARRDECSKALRKKAVFLISQKRSENVVDILIKVAREDPSADVRQDAIFWLSNVRDPRVVDLLAEMANSSDPTIAEKAIFSLSNTRSERASQILRDIAQKDGASKQARDQAIFWLGNRKDPEAVNFLKGLYSRLNDKDLKDRVLFSVANQRGAGSGEWLVGIATDDREPMELRKQALFWAGNQRAAAITDITALYDKVKDREMKEQIIFVLSQNKAEASVDKLMDIARRDTDKDMRSKAVFWLGQSRDPRVLKFLEELINR